MNCHFPNSLTAARRALTHLASIAGVAYATVVAAQPPQPATKTPTLPEVVVEGRVRSAPNDPTANESVFDDPFANNPEPFTPEWLFSPGPSSGYGAGRSVTALKVAVEPLAFPGSAQAITSELLQDQAARTVNDVLRDVSGLGPSIGGSSNRTDDLLIRGFRVQGNSDDFRKNGFRDTSRVQRDLANIERIEILKGPAGAIYGAAGDPAGMVNFLTKQPLEYRQDVVGARFGYWDDYRVSVDSTGPLLDESLTYRLNVAAQNSDSFRDYVFDERYFVAPVLRWRLSDDTTLTIEGEYLRDRRVPDRGVVLFQNNLNAIPISRFLGEPTDRANFHDGQVSAILHHFVNDTWTLRTGWVSNWSDEYRDQTDTLRLAGGGASPNLQRRRNIQDAKDQNHYWIGDLTGTVPLLGFEHQLLLGSEIGVTSRDDFNLQRNATTINIFNPVYGPQLFPNSPRTQNSENWQYGLYVQDLISINDNWKALAGVRQNWIHASSLDTQVGPTAITDGQVSTTPRFGLVYQWLDWSSVYGAYSQSFNPVVGLSRLGSTFSPETGEAYEYGVKFELLEQQLWATLAGFRNVRDNVLVTDPVNANFLVQVGQARSQGVEFDLLGQVTPAWSLIANAAYIDAQVTRDTQATLFGKRLDNVPYYTTNLWTRYNLIDNDDRTTGVGFGWLTVGDRPGDATNSFVLGSYQRWDAAIYQRIQNLQLALYAENLFDTFYISSARNSDRNLPGAPFNLRGTAELRY